MATIVIEYDSVVTPTLVDQGKNFLNFARITTGRFAINSYSPIGMSNIAGSGFIQYDNMSVNNLPGQLMSYLDGTVGHQNVHTTSTVRGWNKGGSVTKTDIADAAGGATAATFTYGADQVVVATVTFANINAGQTMWCEADIKQSAATPLDAINLEYQLQGKISSFTLNLTADWQRFRLPLITATTHSAGSTFAVQFAPRLFLDIGVKDSFDIGRFALYHLQGPTDYSVVAI